MFIESMFLTLLQQGGANPNADAAAAAGMLVMVLMMVGVMLLIQLAVFVAICLLIINAYKHVPAEHQKMAPGMVWLLLIPLFNLVWNFIVFQRIPESFQSAFEAKGRTDVGDSGKQIGMWFAICAACSIIPCVNYIAGPASLVLLIIFIVKLYDLKGKLTAPMAAAPPPGATPPTAPS